MKLEERFVQKRKEAGLSQKKIAVLSGVSYASVRRFESSGEISLKSMKKLLAALQMDRQLDNLFTEETSVPKMLYPFFWDVNPEKLRAHSDSRYIIARLLTKGDAHAMGWVDYEYSPKEIRDCAIHARDLSPQTAAYLSTRYHVPHEQMAYYRQKTGDWKKIPGVKNDT